MKSWQIIVPVGLAAAGAAVFALASKKNGGEKPAKAKADPKAKKAEIKNAKTGSYSFVSGYTDASTVEVKLTYNGETQSFDVIEEEFPVYSSDSHVGVFYGVEFDMQLEYANYYSGEDFAAMTDGLKARYGEVNAVSFNGNNGVSYIDGDVLCICLPIPGDAYSYILCSVMKHKDCKTELKDMAKHAEVETLLGTIAF